MEKVSLKINRRITVQNNNKEYLSNIQDIKEEYIAISIPVNNGFYLTPRQDDILTIIYYENGGLYSFVSKVLKRKLLGNIPIVFIEKPEVFKKIQRRKHVRLKYITNVFYTKLDKQLSEENGQSYYENNLEKFKKAVVLDISGGGCKLNAHEKMNDGDILFLRYPLENECLNLTCKIVRTVKHGIRNYDYGVFFVNLNNKTRDRIIKFIFKIMRQQRQKVLNG